MDIFFLKMEVEQLGELQSSSLAQSLTRFKSSSKSDDSNAPDEPLYISILSKFAQYTFCNNLALIHYPPLKKTY